MSKSFCIFPFIQSVVRTSGSIGPCCRIQTKYNIKDTTLGEYWESKELNDIKDRMLANEANSLCQICYSEETNTGKSMRTGALTSYKFYHENLYKQLLEHYQYQDLKFPNRLELHLGNLCNLKCLTCNPTDSSAFLEEDRSLKISNLNQKDYQLTDESIQSMLVAAFDQGIDILDLRGGETMLSPIVKKVLLNWPVDQAKKITLRIQTNCTIFSKEWETIFQKFKSLEIMMSIDAYGQDNEYIRYPSQWQQVAKHAEIFNKLPNTKCFVNCTVSNLNFLLLPKLINWCREKNIYFHWSLATQPPHFHFTNMPYTLFAKAQKNLSGYQEVQALSTHSYNQSQHWNKFCEIIDLRDGHRKNRIFDILPNYREHWSGVA